MARAGECPACSERFDHETRLPMVSVVCGHSLCSQCIHPTPSQGPDDDAASISTSSSDADDDSTDAPALRTCPVCNAPLAGFVKNFDAIAALEAEAPPPTPAAPDLTTVVHGDLVIDRKDIKFVRSPVNELGAGASAVVYRGVYQSQPVAVKCIRVMSDSFTTEDRLRRELRNASRLKNAHIVEFRGAAWDHEAGPRSPRNVLLVTELMAGGNLRESLNTLKAESGLSLESFVQIGLQITRGIEYLHAEGLAHRDIKSANILLTERLSRGANKFSKSVRAKIADFGLSKYIDKATGGGTVMQSIMEPGRLEATYAYLAPESFGGDKTNAIRRNDDSDDDDGRYDEMAKKRDIYALGVLFWEMLTGQIPWAGISLPDVYVRVCVRSDRPAPALDDAKVSKSVRRLVERCWAQNPTRRPSARSIAAKLEKIAVKIGLTEPAAPSTVKTSAVATATVEAMSAAPGQTAQHSSANGVASNATPIVRSKSHKEPSVVRRELPPLAPARGITESFAAYQKMPSASTLQTTHNEESKTHSANGFEGNDSKDVDRLVDDIPGQFDDAVWVEDAESNKQSSIKHANSGKTTSAYNSSVGNTTNHNAPSTTAAVQGLPTPKSFGSKSMPRNGSGAIESGENEPSSLNRRQQRPRPNNDVNEFIQTRPQQNANTGQPNAKPTATAVAATAAAIAAAKDRERKRDDVRAPRPQVTRVTRPGNTPATAGNVVAESSFQSLPSPGEVWQRNVLKERQDNRGVFYENSDEEAQDFDPERAAAEEAIANSNSQLMVQSTSAKHITYTNRQPAQAQRSSSMNRVAARPKSPIVRRPASPAPRHLNNISVNQLRQAAEEDSNEKTGTGASAPRTSDTTSQRRNSGAASRGKLSRTLSASTPSNATGNRASQIITAGQTATSQPDTGSKRAFIRRMRSNESPRRIARSSSTTGVENKRPGALQQSKNSHVSDHITTEEDDVEYTVVQIGSGPKEDFQATVGQLDKAGVIQLFSQKMVPLRLAALAHATLISPRHRNEEELLRNSCAILHRLTVPGNSPQSKNNVQEISAKEQLAIRKFLKNNQGVEALLQAMHPPQVRHPTTLSYALLALGNLTAWDLEAHKQFRVSHGVVQITQVMKTHMPNSGVQEKGCYALACVGAAYPAKSKTVFEQAGALDVVIQALAVVQRDSPNDAVTKQACAALGAMCSSSPPNALYAARQDALTFLVTAFERFRRASRVDGGKRSEMRLVCKAFIDLLCHTENRKVAGSKGGSAMIIRAMRIFRLDADFIEKGLTTLSDFCTYKSNGTQIVQANGVDDIVAAMERFRMSVNMQREGSRVLTLLMKATGDQARRRIVHAGGAEAVAFALERFGGVPDSNVPVVVETCRALHMLFCMENAAEGEILGRRMKKIKCDKALKAAMVAHKTNQTVQEKAKEALKQLGNLKGGSGLWGRMRSGQKKR